jgi:hypothetical protein
MPRDKRSFDKIKNGIKLPITKKPIKHDLKNQIKKANSATESTKI